MKECHSSATNCNEILSDEFKKSIRATIRNEFLETYKRRYSQMTAEDYSRPSSRSVSRYLNEFSKKLLKSF